MYLMLFFRGNLLPKMRPKAENNYTSSSVIARRDEKFVESRNVLRPVISIALLFVLSVSSVSRAQAEYVPPDQVEVKTTRHKVDGSNLEFGKYEFSVEWEGLPVATAFVTVEPYTAGDGHQYVFVQTKTKTARIIDLFYRLRHRVETVFDPKTFDPLSYYSYRVENSRHRSRHVVFDENGRISSKLWKKGKESSEISFISQNQTLDPVTAAFLAKSVALEEGKEVDVDVFNGKHRFLITFHVIGKDYVKVGGVQREAYKVQPKVRKLTDSKGEESRLRSAYLWVSADSRREVLKLESEVWVGSVSAELEKFEPIGKKYQASTTKSPVFETLAQRGE